MEKTKKQNKYNYYWVVQTYWDKWEDSTFEESYLAGIEMLQCYRKNQQRPHRLVHRRVLNPLYNGGKQ